MPCVGAAGSHSLPREPPDRIRRSPRDARGPVDLAGPLRTHTWNLLGEFTGNRPDLSPGSPPIVRGTFRQDLVDDGRARERLADAAFADDAEDNGQADAIEGAKDVAMGGEFDNQIEDREEEMAGAQMPGQARP